MRVGVLLPLLLPVGGDGHAPSPAPSSWTPPPHLRQGWLFAIIMWNRGGYCHLMDGWRMVEKAVRMLSVNCLHSGWSTHSLSPIASSM